MRRSGASISAEKRKSPAVKAKTTQTVESASRSPPRAGPTQKPRLSMVLELTLAAVSSSGVLASEGSSADWAGWNAVLITATVAART